MNRGLIAISLLFLASLAVQSSAQTQEPPVFQFEFSVYSYANHRNLYYQPKAGARPVPLEFLNSARSRIYPYEGTFPLGFYEADSASFDPEDPENPLNGYRQVGTLNLASAAPRMLFLFFQRPNEGGRSFAVFPLDDTEETFPFGSVRFFNATARTLGARLRGEIIGELPPGPSRVFPGARSMETLVVTQTALGDFRPAFEGVLEMQTRERLLVVFFPPVLRGSSEIQYRLLYQTRGQYLGRPDISEEEEAEAEALLRDETTS